MASLRRRRELELEFLTDEPGFPYPFETMKGGWEVEARGDGGAAVRVWWLVTPQIRWLGPVLLPVMVAGVRRDFPPVVRSMAGQPQQGGAPVARAAIC